MICPPTMLGLLCAWHSKNFHVLCVCWSGIGGEEGKNQRAEQMCRCFKHGFFLSFPSFPPPPLCQETKAHEATRNGSFFSFLYVKINVRGRVKNLLLLLPFPATSLRNVIRVCWPLLFPSPPPPFFLLPVVSLIKVMSTERKGGGGKKWAGLPGKA